MHGNVVTKQLATCTSAWHAMTRSCFTTRGGKTTWTITGHGSCTSCCAPPWPLHGRLMQLHAAVSWSPVRHPTRSNEGANSKKSCTFRVVAFCGCAFAISCVGAGPGLGSENLRHVAYAVLELMARGYGRDPPCFPLKGTRTVKLHMSTVNCRSNAVSLQHTWEQQGGHSVARPLVRFYCCSRLTGLYQFTRSMHASRGVTADGFLRQPFEAAP